MIRNALFVFGICAAIFIFFLPSYLQMQELHAKNVAYERQIRDLTKENETLLDQKRRLEDDPAYFESYAREKFGIIRDDEVIYKIVPAGTMDVAGQKAMNVGVGTTAPKSTVKSATGPAKKTATKSSSTKKKTTIKKTSAPSATKSTVGTQPVNKSAADGE